MAYNDTKYHFDNVCHRICDMIQPCKIIGYMIFAGDSWHRFIDIRYSKAVMIIVFNVIRREKSHIIIPIFI